MKRYIYAFDTAESARSALEQLKARGFDEWDVSLIARPDIQRDRIPDSLLDATTDFVPALRRGAVFGGIAGLSAGVILGFVPALGIGLAVPELIAFIAGGALIGAWSSALIGSTVPDPIRRAFDSEIEDGRTLLIVCSRGGNDRNILRAMSIRPNRHLLWQSDSSKVKVA